MIDDTDSKDIILSLCVIRKLCHAKTAHSFLMIPIMLIISIFVALCCICAIMRVEEHSWTQNSLS